MKTIRNVINQPPRVWGLILQAVFLTAWYRWRMLHTPFEQVAAKMGTAQYETPEEPITDPALRQVQYAVAGVSKRTPWYSNCMVQALTAKKLLNGMGYRCTLYMGLKKDPAGKLEAHAWLRCGTRYITGGDGQAYTATGMFGDK